MFTTNDSGVTDDAPTQTLRAVQALPPQPWPLPPVHNDYIAPTIHSHKFRSGPGKRGRTIVLNLMYTQCRTSTATSMTWDVNVAAVGPLAPGTRVRAMSISLGRAGTANATQNIVFDGIQLKNSHYADGSAAPFQMPLLGAQAQNLSGQAARPMELANLNVLVANTITARYASESNGTLQDIRAPAQGGTGAFQAVICFEEPDVDEE